MYQRKWTAHSTVDPSLTSLYGAPLYLTLGFMVPWLSRRTSFYTLGFQAYYTLCIGGSKILSQNPRSHTRRVAKPNLGLGIKLNQRKFKRQGNFIFSYYSFNFLFILLANLIGMVPYSYNTSSAGVTFFFNSFFIGITLSGYVTQRYPILTAGVFSNSHF